VEVKEEHQIGFLNGYTTLKNIYKHVEHVTAWRSYRISKHPNGV